MWVDADGNQLQVGDSVAVALPYGTKRNVIPGIVTELHDPDRAYSCIEVEVYVKKTLKFTSRQAMQKVLKLSY